MHLNSRYLRGCLASLHLRSPRSPGPCTPLTRACEPTSSLPPFLMPTRHVMARFEADRSLQADIRKNDQNVALAKWHIDHHADPPPAIPFMMSQPEASKLFVPSQQPTCHRHLATLLASWVRLGLLCNPRTSLRQSLDQGSWTADEILSAARSIFRHPGLAWTTTPGAGGHKQTRTNFAIINPWNTGAVNVQGRHARLCLSFQPEAPQVEHSSSRLPGPSYRLATPNFS